jgi:hypothetical protein
MARECSENRVRGDQNRYRRQLNNNVTEPANEVLEFSRVHRQNCHLEKKCVLDCDKKLGIDAGTDTTFAEALYLNVTLHVLKTEFFLKAIFLPTFDSQTLLHSSVPSPHFSCGTGNLFCACFRVVASVVVSSSCVCSHPQIT